LAKQYVTAKNKVKKIYNTHYSFNDAGHFSETGFN